MKRRNKCRNAKKNCYPTKEDALAAAEARKLLGLWNEGNGHLRAYKCKSCGKYHLTSMSRSQKDKAYCKQIAKKWGLAPEDIQPPKLRGSVVPMPTDRRED